MNTTCSTSLFLVKRGLVCSLPFPPGTSTAHMVPGSQAPPFTQRGLALLPSQKARTGRIHVLREKVDFISSTRHSEVGPYFIKHVFGK